MAESRTQQVEEPLARPPAGATPAHECLGVFLGTWRTAGEILGGDDDPPQLLRATDRYEWLPGGHFMVHHVDGSMGGHPVQALEVIGWDAERGDYFSHSYDNGGNVATYRARLDGRRWQILGTEERFDGQFSEDGRVLRGRWERLVDGDWVSWMTLSLTRD